MTVTLGKPISITLDRATDVLISADTAGPSDAKIGFRIDGADVWVGNTRLVALRTQLEVGQHTVELIADSDRMWHGHFSVSQA